MSAFTVRIRSLARKFIHKLKQMLCDIAGALA